MTRQGQAEAAGTTVAATTEAPKKKEYEMYEEMEQGENVARGCVKVTEIIAYDATKEPRRYMPEKAGDKGEIMTDKEGNILYVEVGRQPYFCQTKEQESIFAENNPGIRTETFGIQLLKSTAIKYLDDPRNIKQFTKKELNNGR